ncbi:TetR family transcriptional regulator [Tamaricihabitans halophyticus]|uniref:TetR family transcriptional regulator n=1 Tax=Tamaricihabitans halophyticus TaxID=1262583 RepID=A0A4R2R3N1_9PSEU|nr:TetR/AcrR family transcriptional regulator [Tamaricihabitans halophyticus]TCP53985.1 TetR family transcriptional regulator [Tamaricihabitans halophyticus]
MGTRDRILDAAARVMGERGLAYATTKEIAKAAGYSEAALYKHFRDKGELCLAVLLERIPGGFGEWIQELPQRVGVGELRAELVSLARLGAEFYAHSFGIMASVFSDQQLLAAHRASMIELGAGPQLPRELVAEYFAAEQRGGRISPAIAPQAAADLLVGACLQCGFLASYEASADQDFTAFAESVVDTLLAGAAG